MSWHHDFKLKDLISHEDKTPAEVQVIGQTLVARLKAHPVFGQHQANLEDAFGDAPDQDALNNVLDNLYDAADELRVWVS